MENEFKGTKGEWKHINNNHYWEVRNDCDFEDGSNNLTISCHLYTIGNPIKEKSLSEESQANAKLISAAPDLLEALQVYLNAGHKEARKEASILAKQAIKKAIG